MTDPAARAAELLAEHRASIDRLDAVLVFTLAERFKHTQSVGRLKAQHDLPPDGLGVLEALGRGEDQNCVQPVDAGAMLGEQLCGSGGGVGHRADPGCASDARSMHK